MDQEKWMEDAMEKYEKPLLQYAYNIVKNRECAREIVQETFLKLFKQEQTKVSDYLSKWLFTVCRNHALTTSAKERKYVYIEENDFEKTTETYSVDADFNMYGLREMLMKHLGKLSKKQHDVIRARYWGNLSYKQIAEQFKLSVENVGFILSKSIKKLRMRMNAEDSLENLLISLM